MDTIHEAQYCIVLKLLVLIQKTSYFMTTTIIVLASVITTLAFCFIVYKRLERNKNRWYNTNIAYFYNADYDFDWGFITSLNYLPIYKSQEEQIATAIFFDLKRDDKLSLMSKHAIGLKVSLEELSPQGKLSRIPSVEKLLESYIVRDLRLNSQYSGEFGFEEYCKDKEELKAAFHETTEEGHII